MWPIKQLLQLRQRDANELRQPFLELVNRDLTTIAACDAVVAADIVLIVSTYIRKPLIIVPDRMQWLWLYHTFYTLMTMMVVPLLLPSLRISSLTGRRRW